jgi:hypothetical protein
MGLQCNNRIPFLLEDYCLVVERLPCPNDWLSYMLVAAAVRGTQPRQVKG